MLTLKYAPKKIDDIIGNTEVKKKIRVWILKWLKGEKQRAILLYGKTGVGKTSLAYALANEYNLDILELSSSDFRDKATIAKKLGSSTKYSLFGRMKLILVDDIDAITYKDRGGIAELSRILSNPTFPIILTANDIWNKKLQPIRNEVTPVEMKAISASSILNFIKKIAKKENIKMSEKEMEVIAKNCDGDVRSALNDLESKMLGFRDRKINIFETLASVFKSTSLRDIKFTYLSSDVDLETLKLWISQNIPEEYENKFEIANAFNFLSRADIFDGRIKSRQYWGFMRYSSLLATAGVSLVKSSIHRKFTRYKFPTYLKQMSNSMSRRRILRSICNKIGKRLHLSPAKVFEDFSFYSALVLKNPEYSYYYYKLTKEEIKFIKSTAKLYK